MSESSDQSATLVDITEVGTPVDKVPVTIGPRFLALFSEQLYKSPNKAFEELISNAWDAGARTVQLGISQTHLWVLDDGASMDLAGLRGLWAVANSPKEADGFVAPTTRPQIGRFGIGKLATYPLAHELTYICAAADGKTRAITLDYRRITDQADGTDLHVDPVDLEVRELNADEVGEIVSLVDDERLSGLIRAGNVAKGLSKYTAEDEYGGDTGKPAAPSKTWTLVVLSDLKERGLNVQPHQVKRMLRAALPLGTSMRIAADGQLLEPSKLDIPIDKKWVLGEDEMVTSVTIGEGDDELELAVTAHAGNQPWLSLEAFPGKITGEVKLYSKSIAGQKSDAQGRSNGFFVNVRGRVVNLDDAYFGLPALSHTAWSKLRVTIRADGLHDLLAVSREGIFEGEEVEAFRELLRAIFNAARKTHDDLMNAAWPGAHEVLTDSWGAIPLAPLLTTVSTTLENQGQSPTSMVDSSGIADFESASAAWDDAVQTQPADLIRNVEFVALDSHEPLARYEVANRRVIINSSHPFALEHSNSREEQELLRDAALADLLTDAYMLEAGVAPEIVEDIRRYRDRTERLLARVRRQSGPMLAHLLTNATDHDKALETALGDALDFLGFDLIRQGQRNKPEGIATARLPPDEKSQRREYRFIYEAKSTTSSPPKVSTKDVNVSGQKRHRNAAAVDTSDPDAPVEHALVVAPNFEQGALEIECEADNITPMRAQDLARLLMSVAANGPLNLESFRAVLELSDPDEVAEKVTQLTEEAEASRAVTVPEVVKAMERFDNVDTMTASAIATILRQDRTDNRPTAEEVKRLLYGLSVMVPQGLAISQDKIILGTSPAKLGEAVRRQVGALPESLRFGLDEPAPE